MKFETWNENYKFRNCAHWCDLGSFSILKAFCDEIGVGGNTNKQV